ncbi:MAG: Arm DNA-binding domain-containing protein [Pseudomonadota bacterium]
MLTDTKLKNLKPLETLVEYSDSGSLHGLVMPTGSKLWKMAYRFDGKQRTLLPGACPAVTLARAQNVMTPNYEPPPGLTPWRRKDGRRSYAKSGLATHSIKLLKTFRRSAFVKESRIELSLKNAGFSNLCQVRSFS